LKEKFEKEKGKIIMEKLKYKEKDKERKYLLETY
jgi:hypothetical protein